MDYSYGVVYSVQHKGPVRVRSILAPVPGEIEVRGRNLKDYPHHLLTIPDPTKPSLPPPPHLASNSSAKLQVLWLLGLSLFPSFNGFAFGLSVFSRLSLFGLFRSGDFRTFTFGFEAF
jgi:hypothetical protein